MFLLQIQPEFKDLYKICGPCCTKLIEFHKFYVAVLQNEDKLLDIVFNEKLVTPPMTHVQIPAEQIMIGSEIEIGGSLTHQEDIEMSNEVSIHNNGLDIFPNESSSSTESGIGFDDLSSPMDNNIEYLGDKRPTLSHPKHEYMPNASLAAIQSFNITVAPPIENQPMEVEPFKAEIKAEERQKSQCNECGVYVMNVSQHKRCVHDFSGKQECTECKSVFPNRLKLLMHKYYKHVPPRYKCEFCQKQVR